MSVSYYLGWALLLAAFISGAAEVLVKSTRNNTELIVAAHDLLYTIWPSSLLILQIRIENIAPYLWDPVFLALLAMPAWILFGLPGFLCIIFFRPQKPDYYKRLEEARQREQQLLLYDQLAKEAESLGIDRKEDDMRPDHSVHEIFLLSSEYSNCDQDDISTVALDSDPGSNNTERSSMHKFKNQKLDDRNTRRSRNRS